ncbi:MAG: divergent polysaccharide deacetylase family protein [Candidatus Saccharicenans sp.]|uniref:divergent polysaccharide deacetylase family protein n=1 Tax=Candidatus Saccharicenans sp. TaxID=2819258 RepID=UPI00404AEB84
MRQAKEKTGKPGDAINQLARLSIIMVILAIASAAWLDYLNFRQQKTSYLPWPRPAITEARPQPELTSPTALSEFLHQQLEANGLPPEAIAEEKTDEGLIYIFTRITARDYRRLKENFFTALNKAGIKTNLREEKTPSAEVLVTAELRQNSRTRGWLVFRYPDPVQARKTAKSQPAPAQEKKETTRVVAVVIDDIGEDLNFLQELINLKVPLTIAVLPDSSLARECAELAEKNGLEVIIHLPLEAFNNHLSSAGAEGLITTSMSPQDVRSILERAHSLLPQAKGLNNHMGSKATTSENLMENIISFLKEKDLYFLDSRTSPRSVAYELALKKKVPAAARQVFLDADEDRSRVKDRMLELFNQARKNGQAVGIGHPFSETLEVLKAFLPRAAEFGIQLVPVSAVVKK